MVSSSWPLLILNSCGPIAAALGTVWKVRWIGPIVDLGNQPKRHVVGAFVLGRRAEIAAHVLVVIADDSVVAVQDQARLLDGIADLDQGGLAALDR